MKIERAIVEVGIPKSHHDSLRRAIQRILDESDGAVPKDDLVRILKLVTAAL